MSQKVLTETHGILEGNGVPVLEKLLGNCSVILWSIVEYSLDTSELLFFFFKNMLLTIMLTTGTMAS